MREALGLLAFYCSVGVVAFEGEGVGEGSMRVGIVGIGCDSSLKLSDGVGDMAALEEQAAAVEGEVGTLTVHGDFA